MLPGHLVDYLGDPHRGAVASLRSLVAGWVLLIGGLVAAVALHQGVLANGGDTTCTLGSALDTCDGPIAGRWLQIGIAAGTVLLVGLCRAHAVPDFRRSLARVESPT
jgi:hypothetical protein